MKRTLNSLARLILALALALGLAGLAAELAGADPVQALSAVAQGGFGSWQRLGQSLSVFCPLFIVSMGLCVSFAAGLWNIGAEGQILFGAVSCLWVLRLVGPEMGVTGIVLGFLAGLAGGFIWAFLAGFLKIYGRVHEIFCGLGLNFVAQGLCLWLVFGPWKRPGIASMSGTEPLAQALWLPKYPGLGFSPWLLGLALCLFLLIWRLLKRTRLGLVFYALGQNPEAAAVWGLSPRRNLLAAMGLCGALAGLVGAAQVMGVYHQLIPAISSGYGYSGLLAALLCVGRIWALPFICLFFAALSVGSIQLPLAMSLDSSLGGVIQGALVLAFFLIQGLGRRFGPNVKEGSC